MINSRWIGYIEWYFTFNLSYDVGCEVFQMNELICYCFNFTESDIKADILKNRKSTILEKIKAEKRADTCDCTAKNPKGRWCLGDVHRVVNVILQEGDIKPTIDIFRIDTWQTYPQSRLPTINGLLSIGLPDRGATKWIFTSECWQYFSRSGLGKKKAGKKNRYSIFVSILFLSKILHGLQLYHF